MKRRAGKDYYLSTNLQEDEFDFFRNKGEISINSRNFPQHFWTIVHLFAEDSNYNIRNLYTDYGRLFIEGSYKGSTNHLMLRYRLNGDLIVARVKFINRRKGNMTNLFKILKKINRRFKLRNIIIETVTSDELVQWCLKNNFKLQKDTYSNYIYDR